MLWKRQLQKPSSNSMAYPVLLLLICLIHRGPCQISHCKEVVDSGGSVYGLAAQEPGDSRVCQSHSSIFTRGGVRYCFGKQQDDTGGGVFTEMRCPGGVQPPQARPECSKPECQEFAKVLVETMDTSVQPCEDFYQFACGKDAEKSALVEANEMFMLRMVKLLRDPPSTKQDPWEQNLRYIQCKLRLIRFFQLQFLPVIQAKYIHRNVLFLNIKPVICMSLFNQTSV